MGREKREQVRLFILYGTSACHLCEVAESMIEAERTRAEPFELQKVDISESDELFERYGLLIPVLAGRAGRELNWPFSADQLHSFLKSFPQ